MSYDPTIDDEDDECATCGGEGALYDSSYGCDCACPDCSGIEETFEGALWRATAPKQR